MKSKSKRSTIGNPRKRSAGSRSHKRRVSRSPKVRASSNGVTAQRKVKQARQESEAHLPGAFRQAATPTVIGRADGTFVEVNQAFCKMLGYSEREIMDTTFVELTHPDDRQATAINNVRRIVRGEISSFRTEKRYLHKSGHVVWSDTSITAVPNPDGTLAYMIAQMHDITDRIQAEEALRQSLQFNQSILDALPAHLAVLDARGNVIAVNESWKRFARQNGARAEKRIGVGANYLDICRRAAAAGDKFARTALAGIQSVQSGQETGFSLEYPCHSLSQQRWFYMQVIPVLNKEGNVILSHTDITERKLAEEQVAASERRFRALTEKAAEDIILMDAKGQIIYESPHETPLLGFETGEMIGHMGLELVHPDDLTFAKRTLGGLLKDAGKSLKGELRMKHKEGGWRWIHFFATNLLHDPAVSAVVLNLHDITGRKKAEEALRNRTERLSLLSDVASALLTATDPGMFLNGIFARLSDLVGLEVCVQYRLAPDGTHLQLEISRGLSKEFDSRLKRLEIGQGVCGAVAESGQRIVVNDLQLRTDDRTALIRSVGLTAYVCHPLIAKGKLVGTLAFGTRQHAGFDPEALDLIQTVSNLVAAAIEQKLAETALRQARDKLEVRVAERTADLARINQQLTAEIAERSRAEESLRRQAALLNMASDAIFIREFDGCIHYWNQGAERLYGYTQEEAKGRISFELLQTAYPEGLDFFKTELTKSGVWMGELTQTTKSGEKVIVETHKQVLKQPDGTRLVLETNHDLTARIQLHEEIVAIGERERQRIGQDLHDGLCQLLTAARLKNDSLRRVLCDDDKCAASVKATAQLLTKAVEEARSLARGLEPVAELPEGLMAALRHLADSTRRFFSVDCTCSFPEKVYVSDHRVASELFRIAQEAINNAIKHSRAKTINISLVCKADYLVLQISCDGRPFPKRPRNTGLGLKTMNLRAQRIQAVLKIQPGSNEGTQVRCVLPVHGSESQPVKSKARTRTQDQVLSLLREGATFAPTKPPQTRGPLT